MSHFRTFVVLAGFVVSLCAVQFRTANADDPRLAQTTSFLTTFVNDYNRHDLRAAMALVGTHIRYVDCNYSTHVASRLDGKQAVRRWFKRMFALHDQMMVTSIAAGGWSENETWSPSGFGLIGTRTNDAIKARGLPPQSLHGSKGLLSSTLTRMKFYLLADQASCDA